MSANAPFLNIRELSEDDLVRILLSNPDSRLDSCLLVNRATSEIMPNWIIYLTISGEINVGYPYNDDTDYYSLETYSNVDEVCANYRIYIFI